MFADRDAELLALKISGAVLPPPELYEQIHSDLTAIRQAYPAMTAIHHRSRWAPGSLLVQLTTEAMTLFENGDYHGLDALNAEYGPVKITSTMASINLVSLYFQQRYNPEFLAPLYAAAEGVEYATLNMLMGDGSNIEISDSGYVFSLGWGDCPAGCTERHNWVFTVVDGVATLVDERGDPLITGLHADNDGPTILGHATNLTAKVTHESFNADYTWDFGDGTFGEGDIVNHTYPAIGNYTAIVTAKSFDSTVKATTMVVVIPH